MLGLLDRFDGSAAARELLDGGLADQLARVLASRGGGDVERVARAEDEVAADPRRCIRFDDRGHASVHADGCRYDAGRFEVVSLRALRESAVAARERAGRPACALRMWVFEGDGPLTDIGALQASSAADSLFQVASQFNCLESPGAHLTRVANYVRDPTQGPRAAISAFPGALVRHYAAPAGAGERFVQVVNGRQVELLAEVCDPGVAVVRNGYLRTQDIAAARALAATLEERFEAIRVGVHDGIEVVLGHDWNGAVEPESGRTIAQVFTSTIAGGGYGAFDADDAAFASICRSLQRAAYFGTLVAAAALGKQRVVLTLIGGGVFANPIPIVWESILWAVDEVRELLHRDLLVVVNGRNLGQAVSVDRLREAAGERGGALVRFAHDGRVSGW